MPDVPHPADPAPSSRPTRLPAGFAAFKHRNYRLFFTGQLISVTGTWMQSVAQAWLVLTLTDSPLQFSLVTALQFAPVLFLAIPAGVVADRFPKRSIIVATQIAAMLIAASLWLLVVEDRVALWHVYVLALLLGIVNAFDMPTRQAFVVDMVGRADMGNAIALNSSLFNAARIIGPAIAGVMLATKGAAWCFGLNAVSYLAVIAGLLLMRLPSSITTFSGSGIQGMREGLAYVRATPVIMMTVSVIGFVAVFGLNYSVWLPLLAKHEFDVGADGFGVLMAALGVGSLAGALALAFANRGARPRAILLAALLLGAGHVGLAVCAAAGVHVAVALLVLPLMGFVMSTTTASANTVVQTVCPAHMRGRVMSVYMAVLAGTGPVGALLTGVIADRYGTPVAVGVCGAVMLLAVIGIAALYGAWNADAPAVRLTPSSFAVHSGSRD